MNPIHRTILTIVSTVSFVAAPYYFWSGFEHLGTSGTGSQPTLGAISVIVFLLAFFTAVQLTPKNKQELTKNEIMEMVRHRCREEVEDIVNRKYGSSGRSWKETISGYPTPRE